MHAVRPPQPRAGSLVPFTSPTEMDDDTSNTDVMEADSPTQMEALAARRRDRSLSLTLSNVSSRAAFSDDGFCFSDFLGSGDDSDIEMDLLPWPEEEVAEEPRGRSPAREPSPSERSESPALPAKTSLDLAPPAKKPNLKPFSIVDESGRTIRMVHMTEFGPKIIDYGESGPVTVFDTPADLGATNKQKGNALVLGMFYCDPKVGIQWHLSRTATHVPSRYFSAVLRYPTNRVRGNTGQHSIDFIGA